MDQGEDLAQLIVTELGGDEVARSGVGLIQFYSDCGDTGAALAAVAAQPPDGSFIVAVIVQMTSEADLAVLDLYYGPSSSRSEHSGGQTPSVPTSSVLAIPARNSP